MHTKEVSATINVGAVTKTFASATYTAVASNKKVAKTDPQLWAGNVTGALSFP